MTPEEKSLLIRTHALAEENNLLLRRLRRSNRWSIAFRVVYWVIILGLGWGLYYTFLPYLSAAAKVVNQGGEIINSFKK